eukprot:CAMPEP_0119394774 /NCGR_PEP_ID=MMETSP1334-20130426/130717_1 /TAXON_ID=127549 /ORGANISM="Calcidiscus leptoporus, Strain RCC1130" /LENGTH=71 /DNA_ID=CAMNT_0007418119 /DNA_START=13 /DNA_END=226 /DNA_ORIENTATION=-
MASHQRADAKWQVDKAAALPVCPAYHRECHSPKAHAPHAAVIAAIRREHTRATHKDEMGHARMLAPAQRHM